jgi:hypothetical protein
MKEARRALYALGKSEYRSQSLLDMIQVDPVWVALNLDGHDMIVEKLPQILNTMGKSSMIVLLYDCIPEATVNITLRYPDELEKVVAGLLDQVQRMGLFNKRRTTIKSIKLLK